jgi:hypothetical protein
MNTHLLWVIIAVAIVIAIGAWLLIRRERSARLRRRFGPEYERTVKEQGGVRKAEATLQARAVRIERLHIPHLAANDVKRFSDAWRVVQALFVDDPRRAVAQADRLIAEVMTARGYPVGDFEQRADDISVDHPNVVMNYRAAHDIANSHAQGRASTEDLRQAMVHYHALFAELLEETAPRVDRHVDEATTAAGRGRR